MCVKVLFYDYWLTHYICADRSWFFYSVLFVHFTGCLVISGFFLIFRMFRSGVFNFLFSIIKHNFFIMMYSIILTCWLQLNYLIFKQSLFIIIYLTLSIFNHFSQTFCQLFMLVSSCLLSVLRLLKTSIWLILQIFLYATHNFF